MQKTNQILKEVLQEIKPAEHPPEAEQFLAKLNVLLKKNRLSAKAMIGGSFAKDTWLKGDHDVDIFVKFALKYNSEELSDLLAKALSSLRPERIHGSRDYFHIYNKLKYEIVPVLDIKKAGEAKNLMDFTPWHVAWTNKTGKKLKDDIRLTKKFCKAQHAYGAESYIRGFSGHVVDILTIYYGGFLQLVRAASKWKPKVVLDYNNALKGKALFMLNKSKTESPLIIVDPVQPDRNSAAALSDEAFEKFVKSSKAFLSNPSKQFFFEKKIDFEALKKKGKLIVVNVEPIDDKEDIAGTKMVKAFEYLRGKLADFWVVDAGWEWDKRKKSVYWYLLKHEKLSATQIQEGPPAKMKDHADAFRKKHKKTFIKAGKVFAEVKREFTAPEELVKAVIKSSYVKERVVKCLLKF